MLKVCWYLVLLACGTPPRATSPGESSAPRFRRGVVVNHWLASNYDEEHRYGGAWFDREDVQWIARHGFDHIRFRVSLEGWVREDGSLDPARLAPLDQAIEWAAAERVGVVVAPTNFGRDAKTLDLASPDEQRAAEQVWRLLAQRYAAVGDHLRFELLHHKEAEHAERLHALNAAALAAVRAVSQRRFVYLSVAEMRFGPPAAFRFPDERTGLVVSYDAPEDFTFQFDDQVPLVRFPDESRPERTVAHLDRDFARFGAWVKAHARGREVLVAEVGVYHRADDASQRAYLGALRAALDRYGLAWSVYDYESGCAMRGRDGTPTVTWEALGLGEGARELRFAVVEGGAPNGVARIRSDGQDLGIDQPIDATRHRVVALALDGEGLPVRFEMRVAEGHPGFADIAEEHRWREGVRSLYVPRQEVTAMAWVAARWLLAHAGARLPLEPRGEAWATVLGTLEVGGVVVTPVAVRGLAAEPVVVWLDSERQLFAIVRGADAGGGTIREAHVAALPALAAAQRSALAATAENSSPSLGSGH